LSNELANARFRLEPVPKKRNIDVSSHEATIADAMKRLLDIQANIKAKEQLLPAPRPTGVASASHASVANQMEPHTHVEKYNPEDVDDAFREGGEQYCKALALLNGGGMFEA
jgi:hypothetical protein